MKIFNIIKKDSSIIQKDPHLSNINDSLHKFEIAMEIESFNFSFSKGNHSHKIANSKSIISNQNSSSIQRSEIIEIVGNAQISYTNKIQIVRI